MLIVSLEVPIIRSVFRGFMGTGFGISEDCIEIWTGAVLSRWLLLRSRDECRTLATVVAGWSSAVRVTKLVRADGPCPLFVIEEFDLLRVSLECRFAIR